MNWQEFYTEIPRPRKKAVDRLTYGHGVNDLTYVTSIKHGNELVYKCPVYASWCKMLERCYSPKWLEKHPTYTGCSVSEEFRFASGFQKWYHSQITECDGEKLHLDKDILVHGNKIYARETCVFVPQFINKSLNFAGENSVGIALGVTVHKTTSGELYSANIRSENGHHIKSKLTKDIHEAHAVWQEYRTKLLTSSLDRYSRMSCFDPRVGKVLETTGSRLLYEKESGILTTSLR